MTSKLIVANWKMNPASAAEARVIARRFARAAGSFARAALVVCPPAPFLPAVKEAAGRANAFALGAQDVSAAGGGAHTGEVGPDMAKSVGAAYAIIGHSERRAAGDSDEAVRAKLGAALAAGLIAVLCVGERDRNEHGGHFAEIKRQLDHALNKLPRKYAPHLVIAYEPIWAIGKSEKEAMQPDELRETAIFIRRVASDALGKKAAAAIRILYGGSVTEENGAAIVEEGGVDGLLVGRESLKPERFIELIREVGTGRKNKISKIKD